MATSIAVGAYLCKRPLPPPASPSLIAADGGKSVKSTDLKRTIEYFVGGSALPTATVVVIVAGSHCTGKLILELANGAAQQLNLRVIALSLPGWGYSSTHRRPPTCAEWAEQDARSVLQAERVGMFVVAGVSTGAPYAMAIADTFRGSVLGLGVRATFLPKDITDEVAELPECPDRRPSSALDDALPFGWLLHLAMASTSTSLNAGRLHWLFHGGECSKARRDYPEEFAMVNEDVPRAHAHYGYRAALCQSQGALDWGFDPRGLRTRSRLLWWAPDDVVCPPSHSEWLAEHWKATAGRGENVEVQTFDGYGHLGAGYLEFGGFLRQLMAMVDAGAPKMAGLLRC